MTPTPAPPVPATAPAPPAKRRRWRRRLLGFVVLVGVGVWFAPVVVAKTGLRNRIVAAATADLRGTAAVGAVSAGWLSPVELRDVTVLDRQGRTVAAVPRVVTSKTLVGFLLNRADLGEIVIHNPAVDVWCDAGATNVEDVIAEYLKDDGPPPGPTRPAVRLRITDGTARLHDAATGKASEFTGVEVTAAVPADRAAAVAVGIGVKAGGGTVTASGSVGPGGFAEAAADNFPLDSLAAVLKRVDPGLVVTGTVGANLKARWAAGSADVAVEGTVKARDLAAAGGPLRGERVVVPAADLSLKAEYGAAATKLRVHDGRVTVVDAASRSTIELAAVTADVTIPATGAISGAVSLATTGAAPGTLDARGTFGRTGTLTLRAEAFPLAMLAPALRRAEPGAALAGTLSANLSAGWNDGGAAARVDGTVSVRNLDVAGPWLNGDRLRLAAADLPVKAEYRGQAVRVERAELTCDVGKLTAAGAFDPSDPIEKMLDRPSVSVTGDIDLSQLARLLPKLLRVRDGTEVRQGRLVVSLASKAGPGGTAWDGTVRTSALKAVRDGKPLEWAEPLAVEFSARAAAGKLPTFDKLLCKSDFAAVNAQGSAEAVRAAANVYLDRLAARLGEFVDLGGLALRGEATAWLVGTRTPAGAFKADAGADLKAFAFSKPGVRGLAEQQLSVKVGANGVWPDIGPVRLDRAVAELTAGPDRLEVRLTTPIPDVKAVTAGRATVQLVGDLGRWADRLRTVVPVPPEYLFGGYAEGVANLRFDAKTLYADQISLDVTNARFRGAGLDINEPTLTVLGPMTLDRASGETVFEKVSLTSPVLKVRDARFVFAFPAKEPMVISGAGHADGDLNRLASTLQIQAAPDGPGSVRGRGVGPARFRWQGDVTTFGGTLDVTDFSAGPRAAPTYSDKRLKVDLDARYDMTPGRLTVTTGRVERPGLAVEAKGAWSNFGTTQDVDLSGTLGYDLAALTPELRAAIGGGFEARGKGTRPFAVRGRLGAQSLGTGRGVGAPAPGLAANATVGWDAVKAFGFEMGPGEFNARVANNVATANPITATFGGGRVTLHPTVRLDPAPGELTLARGKLIDRAKLTPAVAAGALGYALPVIANAAQAEGEVSFDLDDNRFPLADFSKGTLRGKLLVHRAAVSGGPVVLAVVQLLGEPAPRVVLADNMTVPVKLENGRVHHENLTLTVNGYAIKTNGSVGVDGTLSIVADVPIPGTLPGFKNNPGLKKALEGKVVKVPVRGTMSQPVVDQAGFQAAVAAVARDAAAGAAKDAGRDLLNRELERLFPGMQPGAPPGGGTPPPRPPLFPLPVPKKG